MNRTLSTFVVSLLVCNLPGAVAFAQDTPGRPDPRAPQLSRKPPITATSRKLDTARLKSISGTATMSDLASGPHRNLSSTEKLVVIANMPQRFGPRPIIAGARQASGMSSSGVKYFMSRSTPTTPGPSTGDSELERGKDDLVVCKTTPLDLARQFAGPLMVAGLPSSQNQSVIYPGALFRDSDVVRGVFTPLNLQRTPGSITIDVFNLNGSVSANVANLNDRTQVTTAINQLRSGAADADANTYLEYTEVEFKANTQFNVDMEASTDINLEALIGVPATVGASGSAGLGFERGMNVAVASLNQVYYTISLGGEGPASTVAGSVPAEAVCVTDVQYGRRAFLMVGSFVSRAEASAVVGQLVSLSGEGIDLVSAERQLSASAKSALELGFVRLTVVGGNVQQAVRVTSLASLRNYIESIDPSVAGVNAVPIAYTLRYASDNAPAKVAAFSEFVDRECFRARQVKVTLNSIKPTKVVDFGDEELFGSIKVVDTGNLATGERTLWSKSSSNAVSGRQGTAISVNESATFNLNSVVHGDTEAKVEIELNDRIMGFPDPEFTGARAADRDRGYAKYERKTARAALADVRNAPNGKLTRTYTVEEGDAKVDVSLTFQLLGP